MKSVFNKAAALGAISLLSIFSGNVLAGEFEGKWLLDDTSGKPFEAILESDGTASGTHGDSMKHGTWSEKNGVAVIHWNTGWITRILKDGDHYTKEAFKPGLTLTDKPTNTSGAIKQD